MTTTNDPRPNFFAAATAVRNAAAKLHNDDYTKQTPCDSMNVRALLGHIRGVLDRSGALGSFKDPMAVSAEGFLADADRWTDALDEAIATNREVWANDQALVQTTVFPWVTQDGADSLRMYTNELVVHGWDLATAVGEKLEISAAVVDAAHQAIRRLLPAADRTPFMKAMAEKLGVPLDKFPRAFQNAVEVPGDASQLEQLVAWNGRNPDWSATKR